MNIPQHVAIILDGNGRWAKAKGMPRNYGHVQGAKNVEKICEDAYYMGIKYLTVYAFSTENWKRSKDEVDALMTLLRNYMKTCVKTAKKNHMRVRVIGDKSGLAEDIQASIAKLEEESKDQDGLNFTIAINYGSRDEICRAVKKIVAEGMLLGTSPMSTYRQLKGSASQSDAFDGDGEGNGSGTGGYGESDDGDLRDHDDPYDSSYDDNALRDEKDPDMYSVF